jgi:hypothetical protein
LAISGVIVFMVHKTPFPYSSISFVFLAFSSCFTSLNFLCSASNCSLRFFSAAISSKEFSSSDVVTLRTFVCGFCVRLFCSWISFLSSYATFSPGRSWDQLRVSVCYSQANVKVAGAHTGVTVGPDGATHQALEDVAITRVLPNLTVVVPCDAVETRKAVVALGRMKGPAYFRLGRSKTPVITSEKTNFEIGKAEIFRDGKDVAIIASGIWLCSDSRYNGLKRALT